MVYTARVLGSASNTNRPATEKVFTLLSNKKRLAGGLVVIAMIVMAFAFLGRK